MVAQDLTSPTEEMKTRSTRVEEVPVTRIGSNTTGVRLNNDTTDKSLKYKDAVCAKKSTLKSATNETR